MFSRTCFHCFAVAVAMLAAPPPSNLALLAYRARVMLAERLLLVWRRAGASHVALVPVALAAGVSARIGVAPVVMGPALPLAAWPIDSKAARDLVVSALAQGVSFDDTDDPLVAPGVRAELQLDAIDSRAVS